MPGSGATPARQVGDPTQRFYNAAAGPQALAGLQVDEGILARTEAALRSATCPRRGRMLPATRYVGFATTGDTICARHVEVWRAMGLDLSRMHDDAGICGGAAHGGSFGCIDNFGRWPTLLD